MALRVLTNGDVLTHSEAAAVVTSTKATTNASGIVTWSNPYGGSQIKARVRESPVAYRSLVATGDAYFRAALLYKQSNHSTIAVIVDDPWWGRRISGPSWWNKVSAPWSTTLTMGDEYAFRLTRDNISVAAGVPVDLVGRWSTATNGLISASIEPAGPYASLAWNPTLSAWVDTGSDLSHFVTSTGGWVKRWNPSTATYHPIILPRGHGALGQRIANVAWPGEPTSEGRLSTLTAWYRTFSQPLTVNGSTALGYGTAKLGISGCTSAQVNLYWEDGQCRASGNTDSSGMATFSNLVPGKYVIAQYNISNVFDGIPRVSTATIGPTQSAVVNAGTLWIRASQIIGQFVQFGAVPAAGVKLYQIHETSGVYKLLGSTDANGYVACSAVGVADLIAVHDTYGHARVGYPGAIYWDCALGARFGGHAIANTLIAQDAPSPWHNRGTHDNLFPPVSAAYLESEKTGAIYRLLKPSSGYGFVSEPAPRWFHSGTYSAPVAPNYYWLRGADSTILASHLTLESDGNPRWTSAALGFAYQSAKGAAIPHALGGKVWGNLVAYSNDELHADLHEAERMGAEYGDLNNLYLRVRPSSATHVGMGFTGMQCPFCQGPLALRPGEGTRGYCTNANCQRDGRTYFQIPAVKAGDFYAMRIVREANTDYSTRPLKYHYRPEDYQEDDTYLVLSGAYQRWMAQHVDFGQYSGGVWTSNETISQLQTSQGRTLGPCRLKLQFGGTYTGAGAAFRVKALRGDNTWETQVVTIATGDSPSNWRAINRVAPVHCLEDRNGAWNAKIGFYAAVSSVQCIAGESGNADFNVVNVSPHLNNQSGVRVSSLHAVPYLAEFQCGTKRHPDLWNGPFDRTYLTWTDDQKTVYLQKSEDAGGTWTLPRAVTPAGWTYPAVCKGLRGDLLVAATDTGGTKTKVWKSRSDGSSFVSLAMSFAATRMDIAEGVGRKLFGALLDGTQQEFRVTTEDFSTTLTRPSALAAGGSSANTSTVISTGMGAARAAVVYDRACNLFAAVENAASHVKFWRTRTNGFGWQSTARSFAATDPDVTQGANQKAYLAARSGDTVKWWIGARQLSTVVASATITTGADAERPAVWKLNSRGREALAAVTVGGTVRIYGSKDDGRTWGQKA